jgi:hypothetical protein
LRLIGLVEHGRVAFGAEKLRASYAVGFSAVNLERLTRLGTETDYA